MRWIPIILAVLILLLQYPLWFGKGGWFRVWELSQEVEEQKHSNRQAQMRNAVMDAEVRDLKQGSDAIEERARSELGMVKHGEVFFQVDDPHAAAAPVSLTSLSAASSPQPAASAPVASRRSAR
jgi:cell division protein FtsB